MVALMIASTFVKPNLNLAQVLAFIAIIGLAFALLGFLFTRRGGEAGPWPYWTPLGAVFLLLLFATLLFGLGSAPKTP